MTTRRRPARSRRKTAAAVARATPARAASKRKTREPTIDRDGKATVACPNCGAKYRVPEEALKSRAVCADCHRQFTPLIAAQGRAPRQDNSKPFVYGAVALAAMVLVGFGVRFITDPGQPIQDESPPTINTGTNTPEVRAVMAWAEGVSRRGLQATVAGSDMDAIQKRYGIDGFPYTRTSGQAKYDLEKRIVAALFEAEDTLVFRLYVPDFGEIEDESMVAAKTGRIDLTLKPNDSAAGASAKVAVFYRWDSYDKRFQVSDWKVRRMVHPELGGQAQQTKLETGGAQTQTATTAGEPPTGKQAREEQKPVVPGPLDHLETTSPEDRATIDAAVAQLRDIDAAGSVRNEAIKVLTGHGKAAVPRLLDTLFATRVTSQEHSIHVNLVTRALMTVTGADYAYNAMNRAGDEGFATAEQDRLELVQKWYTWWAEHKDLDDWRVAAGAEEALEDAQEQRRDRRRIDGM